MTPSRRTSRSSIGKYSPVDWEQITMPTCLHTYMPTCLNTYMLGLGGLGWVEMGWARLRQGLGLGLGQRPGLGLGQWAGGMVRFMWGSAMGLK